jgi:hypothetical protein
MIARIEFIFLVVSFIFNALSIGAAGLTEKEKYIIFYNNEWMFYYGQRNKDYVATAVEDGDNTEIFDFSQISDKYKAIAKEYLTVIEEFSNKHFLELKEYYDLDTNFYIADKNYKKKEMKIIETESEKIERKISAEMNSELLPKLKNGVRCMLAIRSNQYIEVAKDIDEGTIAQTTTKEYGDDVFWFDLLRTGRYSWSPKDVNFLDEQGVIKYHEWFYESNMKIRVVKQIRDKDGKYYGKIYADYYKLDEFDKLFDDKGIPRKLNKKN